MPTPEEELRRILRNLYLTSPCTDSEETVVAIKISVSVWTLHKKPE